MSSMFKEIQFEQPSSFEFTQDNLKIAHQIIAKYPSNQARSAIMPLLYLIQKQHNNWVPKSAMDYIANLLEVPAMQVYEVAHFYTMYNKQPVGKNLVQVCRTTPCWLRGSDEIIETCKKKLNIDVGETTKDGKFTLVEVECLGACVNSPVVQINNDYYEDLSSEHMEKIIDDLNNGKTPKPGSQIGRKGSAPKGG